MTLTLQEVGWSHQKVNLYAVGRLPKGNDAYIEEQPGGWKINHWINHQENRLWEGRKFPTPEDARNELQKMFHG